MNPSTTIESPAPDQASDLTVDLQLFIKESWESLFREYRGTIPAFGFDDGFFDLGGDSLLGMMVIARLRDELELEIPFSLLLDHPTIRSLSDQIVCLAHGATDASGLGA